jgi:hypothetical protein
MNRIRAMLFATLCLVSGSGLAAPCAGFTDVDDTNPAQAPFCANVQWLKNRAITLGCNVPGTLYCPNDNVTRLSMAAFMNRLGTALEPAILYREQTIASGTTFANLPNVSVYCVAGPVAVTGFPRAATVSGWVLLHPSTAGHVIGAGAVYSTDGGVTWLGLGGGDYFAAAPTSPTDHRPIPVSSAPQSLDVGQSVLLGIGIARAVGAGPSMGNTDCVLSARIENRTAPTPPFDAAAHPTTTTGGNLRR